MPRQVHLFDRPARFVAGTVGQPGDRTFYLQATGAGRTVSVALEKVQVSLLADALGLHLDLFQRIVVDPCSVSVVRYTETRPFVLRVNDTGGDVAALLPPRRRRRRTPSADAAVGGGAGPG